MQKTHLPRTVAAKLDQLEHENALLRQKIALMKKNAALLAKPFMDVWDNKYDACWDNE